MGEDGDKVKPGEVVELLQDPIFFVKKTPIMVWMLVANTGLSPMKINMTGWTIHHE